MRRSRRTRSRLRSWRTAHAAAKRMLSALDPSGLERQCDAARAVMNDIPETRYAKSGDCHIAYQVVGQGPVRPGLQSGFRVERRILLGRCTPRPLLQAPVIFRPCHPLRQARHRHVGPRACPAIADARAAHGRCTGGDGRRRIAARRAGRGLGGRTAESALRRHLPRSHCGHGPRWFFRARSPGPRTTRSEFKPDVCDALLARMEQGWGKGVLAECLRAVAGPRCGSARVVGATFNDRRRARARQWL